MQKFTQIEDFREGLDIEICATLERDFHISDIEFSLPDGSDTAPDFKDSITVDEWVKISDAIQEAEVYTGY